MSARHTASRDQDQRRLAELRRMLGTGQGIQRVPSKLRNVVAVIARHSGSSAPHIYFRKDPDPAATPFFHPVHNLRGYGWKTIEYSDDFDGLPMETDMDHWRALVRERNAIEARAVRFIQGWEAPSRFAPSPFGSDRFRKFDPTPAFEVSAGPLHFIGR